MASSLNLQRNSEVFFSTVDIRGGSVAVAMTPANTWKLEVLAGFAATSTSATQDITSLESGLNPDRSQQRFNTAINPVDWNIQVYMRPTGVETTAALNTTTAKTNTSGNTKPLADWYMWQALTSSTLAAQTCHTFTIYDAYGDGISGGPGAGSFTLTDGSGTILASGGVFTDEDGAAFKTGSTGTPPVSWDCDAVNGCVDPGTGLGQYTSAGACTAVCNITSIQENNTSEFNIYPNPVKDVLTIEGDFTSANIYDVFGKLVLTSQTQETIDVSTLSNGVYFVNFNVENTITVKKITIAK